MKTIKKLVFFFSFIAFYFIGKEFLNLYLSLKSLNPIFSILFLIIIIIVLVYFVFFPVLYIIKLPKFPSPAKSRMKEKIVIRRRIALFKNNKDLKQFNIETKNLKNTKEEYEKTIKAIKVESEKLRDSHVKKVFLSTAIAQNGFIDGMILISACVNLVKQTFILFGGRVSYKDLLSIVRSVYYSVIISASEGVETGIEELIEKVGSNSIKSIPFAGKVLESFADGFVSATLLCRVGLITENYCTKTLIKSDKELYPGINVVMKSVKPIAEFIRKTIFDNFKKAIGNKAGSVAKRISDIFTKEKKLVETSNEHEFLNKESKKSVKLATKIVDKLSFIKF